MLARRTTVLRRRVGIRSLSSTHIALQEKKQENSKQKEAPPPPPDGRTPTQVFLDVFRTEWKKNDDLHNDIKLLQDATGKMGESEAFKKAKEAYEKAQKGTSVVGKTILKTGEKIGDVAEAAWESEIGKSTRKVVNKTAEKVDEAFEPVRKTQAYKDISTVIGEGSSQYGGFASKEERRKKREQEVLSGKRKIIKSNKDAPTALVETDIKVSKPSIGERWESYKATSTVGKFLADMKMRWDESENGLISAIRTVYETIAGYFAETGSARALRSFKLMDPTFTLEEFLKNAREYIIPELLDATCNNDTATIKTWVTQRPLAYYEGITKSLAQSGLVQEGQILDIRNFTFSKAMVVEPDDIPVMVITCRAQEYRILRNVKTNEVLPESEDNVENCIYSFVFTRIPEEMDNKETEGWKITELVRVKL